MKVKNTKDEGSKNKRNKDEFPDAIASITGFLAAGAWKTYRVVSSAFKKNDVITLNAEDSASFLDTLSKPVRHNIKLQDAIEEHDRLVVSE